MRSSTCLFATSEMNVLYLFPHPECPVSQAVLQDGYNAVHVEQRTLYLPASASKPAQGPSVHPGSNCICLRIPKHSSGVQLRKWKFSIGTQQSSDIRIPGDKFELSVEFAFRWSRELDNDEPALMVASKRSVNAPAVAILERTSNVTNDHRVVVGHSPVYAGSLAAISIGELTFSVGFPEAQDTLDLKSRDLWLKQVSHKWLPDNSEPRWLPSEEIGRGSFAAVCKVRDRTTGRIRAMKTVDCKAQDMKQVKREVEYAKNLKHVGRR